MIFRSSTWFPLGFVGMAFLCFAGSPALAESPTERAGFARDPVKLSFIFMGCNRIQHKDWKKIKADDPSSANLPQLEQTFRDIVHLDHVPPYLFFMGDLVVNLEDDDGKTLKKQLDAWTSLYKASPLAAKTTLVPLPGNHEMLKKVGDDKDKDEEIEVPNPATDALAEMAARQRFRLVRESGQRADGCSPEPGPACR